MKWVTTSWTDGINTLLGICNTFKAYMKLNCKITRSYYYINVLIAPYSEKFYVSDETFIVKFPCFQFPLNIFVCQQCYLFMFTVYYDTRLVDQSESSIHLLTNHNHVLNSCRLLNQLEVSIIFLSQQERRNRLHFLSIYARTADRISTNPKSAEQTKF